MTAGVLARDDPRYPVSLKHLERPPRRLFFEGDLSLLDRPRVAIIGSRRPSAYGERVAYDAARALAGQGAVIVSGMARGLDARAHFGALEAGGDTIAVLGTGLDVDYPRGNRKLLADVRVRGLVLTEHEAGVQPRDFHFPERNRIIAALSQCLLVVEGRVRGGTSNTAEWAGKTGTEMFGVPGRLDDPMSQGPNLLIRDGAQIYLGPNDILSRLGLPLLPEDQRPPKNEKERVERARHARAELTGAEATLFDLIGREPTHVDLLASRSDIEPGLLLAALSSLELQGLVTQLPGKRFTLAA